MNGGKGFALSQTRDRRLHRRSLLGNYLLLLVLTIGAYGLYSLLVVPSIEVAEVKRAPIPVELPDVYEESKEHHRWFKRDDWECKSCSILHTAHGKILFQDHRVEDEKTWFVTPFSLVLQREKDVDADGRLLPPLVLRCASGARLNFNSPVFTKLNSSGNRLESALLQGAVELYRLDSDKDRQDGLRINTSNVQISDRQILTIEDVEFWIGPNHGMGRNMRIHLTHSSPSSSVTRDFSRINGIKNLQLGILSKLQIRPAGQQKTDRRKQTSRLLANDSAPIEITSAGPFEFDMGTHRAIFKENVQVKKLDASGDLLKSDDLVLQFKSRDGSRSLKLDAAADTEFELLSITATGRPAVLQSNAHDAHVRAHRFVYDVQSQLVIASSTDQVDVRQGTSRFLAREIEYQLTQDHSIGSLVAIGPGMLIRSEGNQSFRAMWQNELTVKKISAQQQQVILTGVARLKLNRQTEIQSDEMQFRVWQVPVVNLQNEVVDWEYQPGQLTARGNVEIQSEDLQGSALTLVANWPSNPRAAMQRMDGAALPRNREMLTLNRVQRDQPGFVRRVNYDGEDGEENPAREKLEFNGEQIDVVLAESNQQTQLVELQINGKVSVIQQSQPGRPPTWKVHGHSLKMVPQVAELYQVQVAGRQGVAAKLISDRLRLSGPKIVLDQHANRVWINGAGRMVIESADKPASVSPGADVEFAGGMVFDGQKIYFERDVQAQMRQSQAGGATQLTNASAAAASLKLDRRVDLQNNQELDADPQVVEMILKDRISTEQNQFKTVGFAPVPMTTVIVNNRKFDRFGQLTERVKISAVHAEFDEMQKAIVAYGPGSVEMVRQGGANIAGLSGGLTGNQTGVDADNPFTFIRSHFQRALNANTANQQLVITGDTRTVYSPISNPDQSLDPDRPQSFPAQAVLLRCEQLEVSQANHPYDGRLQSLMVATGNARISSATVQTASDRIRYDEAGDSMVVESDSGRDVLLRSRQNPQSTWKEIVGKRLTYRLSTQSAEAQGVEQITAPLNHCP